MERRDEDWINPPEPKEEEYISSVDSINDEIWLRKKEEEEKKLQQDREEALDSALKDWGNHDDKCYVKGEEK